MALSHLGGQRIWESLIGNGYGRGLWASEKPFPTVFVLQSTQPKAERRGEVQWLRL